jgi:hypothetical protein
MGGGGPPRGGPGWPRTGAGNRRRGLSSASGAREGSPGGRGCEILPVANLSLRTRVRVQVLHLGGSRTQGAVGEGSEGEEIQERIGRQVGAT